MFCEGRFRAPPGSWSEIGGVSGSVATGYRLVSLGTGRVGKSDRSKDGAEARGGIGPLPAHFQCFEDVLLKLLFLFAEFGDGGEEVFAFEEEGEGEVGEEVVGGLVEDGGEGGDAIEFGDGAVDHGRDDVFVEFVPFEEVGDAEDDELAIEVVFESAEGELFIGAGEEFESEGEASFVEGHGGFAKDGEGVELGEGLGEKVDVGVVGLKSGLDDFAAFDLLALPALLAEGVDDGLQLDGRWAHGGTMYAEGGGANAEVWGVGAGG